MTEIDEFGPLTSAGDPDDVSGTSIHERLNYLEQREKELINEREEAEKDFGIKRAKFKELFLQKENDLEQKTKVLNETQEENAKLKEELEKLRIEVGDIKAAVALTECGRQDDVSEMQRKYQEEISSLQHIMDASIDEASRTTAEKYEEDRVHLLKANEALEGEVEELKSKLSQEREGFLATVTKSLKKVSHTVGHTAAEKAEAENLEESFRKAQEDAEILKSVVEPLEEEIKCLKDKLRDAVNRLDEIEEEKKNHFQTQAKPVLDKLPVLPAESLLKSSDEKLKEMHTYLQAEKSSRSDLEMYVAVLNTQRNVLQDETEKFRKELHEVCRLLEKEKKEHNDLKRTWQMANDQFLEAQRLLMKDMMRMESVLTAEQQRQISELQRKEQESAQQQLQQEEKSDNEIAVSPKVMKRSPRVSPSKDKRISAELLQTDGVLKKADSKSSLTSMNQSDDLYAFTDGLQEEEQMKKSWSSSDLTEEQLEGMDTRSLSEIEGAVRTSPERSMVIPSLTEAQHRSITDPTAESLERDSMLASLKAKPSDTVPTLMGKRLVSEKEWQMLQYEIKAARDKLGRPCSMCNNYEDQLQNVQRKYQECHDKAQTLERQLAAEKRTLETQRKYRDELEESLKNAAEDAQKQISNLTNKLYESEKFLVEVSQQYQLSQRDLHEKLKALTEKREEVYKDLTRLQEENDSLIGLHSKHSQAMQAENIDLPNNLEEMQLVLLRYREDIIAAKCAKEHIEDTLRSEIMFLKDQVVGEQQERKTIEETLTNDITNLQEELAILQSVKSELEREAKVRAETEAKLRETDASLKSIQAKSKQLINALQHQVEEQSSARTKLENDVVTLKIKVQSLQVDLDNSETVQRDFVKLSQSLQIQLEKIRQAETEVRWQHEEDIDDCQNCRQAFTVTRRKHHCRHCGRIFCSDCTQKTVPSGPNMRNSKVCDVCHTMLVKDATPYFSKELPPTPD
ncbi:rab GTPase-binding effector protein 1-like isoform X2 [Lineus longissimus]|uniref:rab GTPase-binding effector protein 1-like isoform X2 n=1 Tax=Lineus longissimus TaxID=88925 RepID=UPI002B4F3B99